MRMMHAQVTHNVSLLIIFYRAIYAHESRRLFALMTQMREHRFLPLVQIAATRTLVQAVSLIDIVWIQTNFFVVLPPLEGTIWNPRKSRNVLVISRSFPRNPRNPACILQNFFTDKSWKSHERDRSTNIVVTKVENVDYIVHRNKRRKKMRGKRKISLK